MFTLSFQSQLNFEHSLQTFDPFQRFESENVRTIRIVPVLKYRFTRTLFEFERSPHMSYFVLFAWSYGG